LSVTLDDFRLMFVFFAPDFSDSSSARRQFPVPLRGSVCYLFAVLIIVDFDWTKEPSPWNGSPHNTKRSIWIAKSAPTPTLNC